MIKKKKVLFYRIRTYDGRYNPGDKFTSFKAALEEAKRLFGWKRIYTARHTAWSGLAAKYWYPSENNIDSMEISDKPSTIYHSESPVIERIFEYC